MEIENTMILPADRELVMSTEKENAYASAFREALWEDGIKFNACPCNGSTSRIVSDPYEITQEIKDADRKEQFELYKQMSGTCKHYEYRMSCDCMKCAYKGE